MGLEKDILNLHFYHIFTNISGMSFIKTQAAEEMDTHTSVEEIIRNTFAINEENDSAMKLLSIGGMSKAKPSLKMRTANAIF